MPGLVCKFLVSEQDLVTDVELISAEEVRVKFEVFEKFQKLIRQDSNGDRCTTVYYRRKSFGCNGGVRWSAHNAK